MTAIISAVTGVAKIAGDIISGSKRSKASKAAQAAQVAAQQANITAANAGNAQIQQNLQPYNEAGQIGLSRLTGGLDQTLTPFRPSDLTNDPGYQWRVEQGQRALDRTANARGGTFSGRQLQDTADYGQHQAMDEYDRARTRYNEDRDSNYNKLIGLTGIGAAATTGANAAISNLTGQLIGAHTATGDAQANGALERGLIGAQTWTNAINDAITTARGFSSSGAGGSGASSSGGGLASMASSLFKTGG